MELEYLQKYFDKAKSYDISFKGNCHDCGADVEVLINVGQNNSMNVFGGALYHPQIGATKDDSIFFVKCDECYNKEKKLRNYNPCDVYSRIVGYLRPVKQWNVGKQAEFKERKTFKL